MIQVIVLALLPGLGNLAGAVAAEMVAPSRRMLSAALHGAAGIVIAIVALELIPEARTALHPALLGLAFATGCAAYSLVERFVHSAGTSSKAYTRMWMIYAAVAVDLTSDGLMIGSGMAVSFGLALVLAGGQVLADLPEGFAVVANLKDKGVARRQRLLIALSFLIFPVAAALMAFIALRHTAESVQMAALAFIAGLLSYAAIEDMIGEAHEATDDTVIAPIAFGVGFALFAGVSGGLRSLESVLL